MWSPCAASEIVWLILPFLTGLATGWWAFASKRTRQQAAPGKNTGSASERREKASYSTLGLPYRLEDANEDVRVVETDTAAQLSPTLAETDDGGASAREGADNLQRIKGIGPALEIVLNNMGIRRFDQIAVWNDDDAANIRSQLGSFGNRIERDNWISQAKRLAGGAIE